MTAQVFDPRLCTLGEGPLWHPERNQLFWFDILGKRLLSRDETGPLTWQFDEHVSAAGWVDRDTLLIASETALFRFNLSSGVREDIAALEAENLQTRSNDGRADPWGGFWIGTMGKSAQPDAGAIYRFYKGGVTKLFDNVTISNSICFSPDRKFVYFSDTAKRQIMRQNLDADGWPDGAATVLVDLNADALNPDGAVVDSEGYIWNAQWGASRVARYSADGKLDRVVEIPALQTSCPAFGGPDLNELFVTSAREGLANASDDQGRVYRIMVDVKGQRENQVIL